MLDSLLKIVHLSGLNWERAQLVATYLRLCSVGPPPPFPLVDVLFVVDVTWAVET